MNKLSANTFRNIFFKSFGNNFVFSPASYLELLHNISLCLKGNNLKELLSALDISEENLFDYIKEFKSQLELDNNNYLFSSFQYSSALNYDVINQLKSLGTEIKNFDDFNLENLIREVNSIVYKNTNGKISSLISREEISPLVKFIVLNTVYFKKDWLYKFHVKNHTEPFYGLNHTKNISYLTQQRFYNFYEDDYLDIIEIPYKDSNICCYLLVPTKNYSLFDIINNIDEHYDKINNLKNECEVSITCPEFQMESNFDIAYLTKMLGVNNMFEWNKDWSLVDFSKLLYDASLCVGIMKQKAYIDFNRNGVEATAASVGMFCFSGCISSDALEKRIKYIRADKPFIYVLSNKDNKEVPLFIGIVNDV